jgi:hypothetical protein
MDFINGCIHVISRICRVQLLIVHLLVHFTKKSTANLIGRLLRMNCLLEHVIEGKIKVTGIRGIRRTQLLDCHKERREYCKLKEEALDSTPWRTCCGRGYGFVARQTE